MNICAVAAASGVSMKMIRDYERRGLIGPTTLSPAGNRIYSLRDVHILEFIRCLRSLGYSVTNIRDLLALWSDRSRPTPELKIAAARHAQELILKTVSLRQVADVFIDLTRTLGRADHNDYPILKKSSELSQATSDSSDPCDLRYIGHGH